MNRHNSLKKTSGPLQQYDDPMTRVDPFQQYPDVFKQIIDWSKDPMVRPENQNKYFFSDGKTYYEQICKMLKLMSVFKEAFQQIYDNEDEIHEAWDNFVDNLTATAEYGEEVGVTLTWTEESVNFDFTIPGGEDGTGIQSIVFNVDYTMTITLTDGTTYTSPSLRGETGATGPAGPQGPTGPQGPQGEGLNILDVYPTLADLQQAHPTGSPGDAYEVGSAPTYTLYIWSTSQSAWVSAGSLGSVSPSNTNPLMDGTASPGISDFYSRGDHVHPTDTSRASQSDLNTVSGNLSTLSGQVSDIATAVDIVEDMVDDLSDIVQVSQTLPDQQFLYRESLADHDTIGRLDSIKGNTLVWNQLVQNGNFSNGTSGWGATGTATISVANNKLTFTTSALGEVLASNTNLKFAKNHKGLALITSNNANVMRFRLYTSAWGSILYEDMIRENNRQYLFFTPNDNAGILYIYPQNTSVVFDSIQIFDLTQMGLDYITTLDQFTSLFSLSYYDYTAGKLLPFKGEELKTIGKNLFDKSTAGTGARIRTDTGATEGLSGFKYSDFIRVIPNQTYVLNFVYYSLGNYGMAYYDGDKNYLSGTKQRNNDGDTYFAFTVPSNAHYIRFSISDTTPIDDVQLQFGSSPSSYEPYQSSTLSLPISTYFPTGMKDCSQSSQVFDETTESKAINRVGMATITSFTGKSGTTANNLFVANTIANYVKKPSSNSQVCNVTFSYGQTKSVDYFYSNNDVGGSIDTGGFIYFGFGLNGSVTTLEQANAYVQSNPITVYYELATPTETDITPPLDLTFKAWKGGTEQILPENTSDPYTAPIKTDMTYMSTDEAILYLKDHAVTDPTVIDDIEDLQDDVSDLQTDVGTLQTSVQGIESDLTDYCIVNTYTFTPHDNPYPGGQSWTGNYSVPAVSGYKAIGIAGHYFYRDVSGVHYSAQDMVMKYIYLKQSEQRFYFTLSNLGSTAYEDLTINVYILYIRDNGGN